MQAIDDIVRQPLPVRLQAMERLWDSLCDEPDSVPAWHAGVLAQRVADLDSGIDKTIPWDEAKIRIRQRVEAFSAAQ
jgi:putative addiction module component (TIGR02574 family)